MLFIIFALFILFHLLIGLYDFSFYRIPNLLLGGLLVLYGFYAPLYMELPALLIALLTTLVIFIACFSLYAFKIIGAGDAKYLTISSLWFGGVPIVTFLLTVSIVGGGLSLLYLIFRDHIGRLSDLIWLKIQAIEEKCPWCQSIWIGSGAGPESGKRENISGRMVPYGIAIAAGSIIMLWISPITY